MLLGTVTTAGMPVSGARILVLDSNGGGPTREAITDAEGYYSIQYPAGLGILEVMVSATYPGYFTDAKYPFISRSSDGRLNFELDPWVLTPVGDVVQASIGHTTCSGLGYGPSACERFAFTVPSSGTLEITIASPVFLFDMDVVNPDGTFATYSSSTQSPLQVRIPIQAGLTYEARVVGWGPARDFELRTAVR